MKQSMREAPFRPMKGGPMLLAWLLGIGLCIFGIVEAGGSISAYEEVTHRGFTEYQDVVNPLAVIGLIASILGILVFIVLLCGLFVVDPNESRAMVFFGKYKGTVREDGFFWANPFFSKAKVSLRARNLEGDPIKVNDKSGNPIEIAAVVVWRVADTAQALFDVDDYVGYVNAQSEAALRQLAGTYPYDDNAIEGDEDGGISLRDGREQVSVVLEKELSDRLSQAGVEIIEARLSHLAYAPEIAGVMLQRQQAEAVVAARQRIVDGAVGMVEMALARLGEDQIVELDEERKAAMVSNLLVVLCGDRAASPVVNAGTLYN